MIGKDPALPREDKVKGKGGTNCPAVPFVSKQDKFSNKSVTLKCDGIGGWKSNYWNGLLIHPEKFGNPWPFDE